MRQQMTNQRTGRQPVALEGSPVQTALWEVQRRERGEGEGEREWESERLGEGLSETGRDCMGRRERCCEREGEWDGREDARGSEME